MTCVPELPQQYDNLYFYSQIIFPKIRKSLIFLKFPAHSPNQYLKNVKRTSYAILIFYLSLVYTSLVLINL